MTCIDGHTFREYELMAKKLLQIDIDRKAMGRVKKCSDVLAPKLTDLRALLLPVLGEVHRKQQSAIFNTEGQAGATGKWRALSPGYAKRKAKVAPRAKILRLTGEMRNRFLMPGNPNYIQRLVGNATSSWVLEFGARSRKAFAHFKGAPQRKLPRRDPVGKSAGQLRELVTRMATWWRVDWVTRFLRVCEGELHRGAKL